MSWPAIFSRDDASPSDTGCGQGIGAFLSHSKHRGLIMFVFALALVVTGGVELWMGRSLLGPDGRFGFWEGNIWSSECSQRLVDPYSFSHVAHGILFYALLRLVLPPLAVHYRFLLAVLLEAGWEMIENSPPVIERYREATLALGYTGDSVLNSVSDILMMTLGFLFTSWVRPKTSVTLLVLMEIACAAWIRDNLTLNVIMLLHPSEPIKSWQMGGRATSAPAGAEVAGRDSTAQVQIECAPTERLRILIETDAGGDPDDEQSLVRFLLYANEWDVEGIIANRPTARDKENLNPERTGLGIVQGQLKAYAQCYTHLRQHDPLYPLPDDLWRRTVAGYEDREDGVNLILAAIDKPDPRPVWFCNWGTDHGSASSNLKRALDRVLRERGAPGYAALKNRLRLSSADAFGPHTGQIDPPWSLWVDTFRPELSGKRWYHRFSALTATAGGFDLERDVRTGHGPLGALYPRNTTHPQKEGDTMSFLYLVPTGMNDPAHPSWGSWAGRYGLNDSFAGRNYFWANQADTWNGTTNRDNTLARWAVDLQNDFRARLDWCVKDFTAANHPPRVVVNGYPGTGVLTLRVPESAGADGAAKLPSPPIELNASNSSDPDGNTLQYEWWVYPEAGTYPIQGATLERTNSPIAKIHIPTDLAKREIHVLVTVRDNGTPPLARYGRIVVQRVRLDR